MARAYIEVGAYSSQEDPDGSECECCGDQCFLKMWRAFYTINGGDGIPLLIVSCQSCYQIFTEDDQ